MRLNLPIIDRIANCQNFLSAGMGGGYDIFCGLPIYLELKSQFSQINFYLANLSFSNILFSKSAQLNNRIKLTETLVGVQPETEELSIYLPELYLSRKLTEIYQEKITVWCFKITGAKPLLKNYQILIQHLNIDGTLLIDGGVDSLIRGDEKNKGTFIEDIISLAVVHQLNHLKVRLLTCIGFGAERDITYAHIFQNLAHLTKVEGFLGSCSLINQMAVYQRYEEIVLYTQQQEGQDPSVINSSIISAVRGEYGDYHLTQKTQGSQLWISPLMPIYWFFDLPILAQQNLYIEAIKDTDKVRDAIYALSPILPTISKRKTEDIIIF